LKVQPGCTVRSAAPRIEQTSAETGEVCGIARDQHQVVLPSGGSNLGIDRDARWTLVIGLADQVTPDRDGALVEM
jgi:hypothetical protein